MLFQTIGDAGGCFLNCGCQCKDIADKIVVKSNKGKCHAVDSFLEPPKALCGASL